jgi:maltose alpha-D-glucosyltransferase/alpha-amylase
MDRAVFYQVYPQSFFDSNADGIGDIPGLIQKLGYIRDLGCDALWVNPCFVSPFQDAGYDVADYYRVAPRYGTNADARRLFEEARKLGMRICLDLVLGHSSIEHPWFKASASGRPGKYKDWYIWVDGWDPAGPGFSAIKGLCERDGSYITNFFYCQPALNYGFAKKDPKRAWQQSTQAKGPREVGREIYRVMRFWLKMGASGFRVDMAGSLVKNDPRQKATIAWWQGISSRLKREFPGAVLISEWGEPDRALAAGFDADFMLHFPTPGYSSLFRWGKKSYFSPRGRADARLFLKEYLSLRRSTRGLGHISIPSGNHDMDRISLGRDAADLKPCFAFLLTMPGVPFIYYGDEIGMEKMEGLISKEGGYNRTGSRTPMHWDGSRNRGFSKATASKLYLPMDKRPSAPDVFSQQKDSQSLYHCVRDLVSLRRAYPALQARASFKVLHDGGQGRPLCYLREKGRERILVAIQPKAKGSSLKLGPLASRGYQNLSSQNLELAPSKPGALIRSYGKGFGIFKLN